MLRRSHFYDFSQTENLVKQPFVIFYNMPLAMLVHLLDLEDLLLRCVFIGCVYCLVVPLELLLIGSICRVMSFW